MPSFKKIESKEKKNNTDYTLLIMIFFILVAVISFVIYGVMNVKTNTKTNKTQEEKSKYVYTVSKVENKTQEDTYDKIPAINLDSNEIDDLNKEIIDDYKKISKYSEYDYSYKTSENDEILSLVIISTYAPEEGTYPITFFKTYNIDLEDKTLISNEDLLNRYNVTTEKLKMFIESKFQKYYNDLVKKGYYTKNECDYNCFIENRGMTDNYLDGVSLYVDKSSLTMFKFFYKESDYGEEEYFDDIDYQIVIKK